MQYRQVAQKHQIMISGSLARWFAGPELLFMSFELHRNLATSADHYTYAEVRADFHVDGLRRRDCESAAEGMDKSPLIENHSSVQPCR